MIAFFIPESVHDTKRAKLEIFFAFSVFLEVELGLLLNVPLKFDP